MAAVRPNVDIGLNCMRTTAVDVKRLRSQYERILPALDSIQDGGQPIVGSAQFSGGTGAWSGITGDALFTGKQNGDGTATFEYRGMVYVPQ